MLVPWGVPKTIQDSYHFETNFRQNPSNDVCAGIFSRTQGGMMFVSTSKLIKQFV